MNPRVLLWLRAVGLATDDISRGSGEDLHLVVVGGVKLPWTIHYSEWIKGKWREWAHSLGYVRGSLPWRDAQMDGHTDAEFDAWLEKNA